MLRQAAGGGDPSAALLSDREALGAALTAAAEAHAAHIDALEDRLATAAVRNAAALVRVLPSMQADRMLASCWSYAGLSILAQTRHMSPSSLRPEARYLIQCGPEEPAASCRHACDTSLTACPSPQMAERQASMERGHRQRLAEALALVERMAATLDVLLTPRSTGAPVA